MNSKRKAWTLQNCVAPGPINCVSLGQKSGRVMATGGLDNKVSLWAVGKSGCIMVLSDHNSPIQHVKFDQEENKIAAGSISGSIKVWELEEAKEVRSLAGHKAAVTSVDFLPFGNVLASGSMDCNVKLWDFQRKACIFTYKGHQGSVNCLQFSPDGRWLVSGGNDNVVKIWDLTAGKLLNEFQDHKGSVTSLEFHPNVLMLASSSDDHTIKLFDLESFRLIDSTLRSDCASSINNLCFHPDHPVIYTATSDYLKIYNQEPLSHLESVYVGWQNGFNDMALSSNCSQLVGVSAVQSTIITYIVDIQTCSPFVEPDINALKTPDERPFTQSTSPVMRKSFCNDPMINKKTLPKEEIKKKVNATFDLNNEKAVVEIQDQEEYNRIFKKSNKLEQQRRNSDKPEDQTVPSISNKQSPVQKEPNADVTLDKNVPVNVKPKISEMRQNEDILKPTPCGDISDEEYIQRLQRVHGSISKALNNRQKNLSHIRTLWTPNNARLAIDAAGKIKDNAVFVDLLSVLTENKHLFNLDMACILLPSLLNLSNSKHNKYVETTCQVLKILLNNFSQLIKQNISFPPPSNVDISREERYHKCSCCYNYLLEIRDSLAKQTADHQIPSLNEVLVLLKSLQI